MSSLAGGSQWLWAIGFVIVALLLLVVGRAAARASVAGQLPKDAGPDLKASEANQEPDITPDDQTPR